MKRRTDNDEDRSVAQESARYGSLRGGWCREPAGIGECRRIGRAEPNERGGSPEVSTQPGRGKTGAQWIACSPITSPLQARPATTTSTRALSKPDACETQIDFIGHFDLERVSTGPEDAFVKYLCHTKDGKTFRNVEYLRIKNGQLQSIECYFGAQSSFPSAVSTAQK
jgi:hypothetical protein